METDAYFVMKSDKVETKKKMQTIQ